MEQFERIRHDKREEGLSMRALARRHGVHRRTVRQAVAAALPPPRAMGIRPAPVTGAWRPLIRSWLIEDRTAPRKQRHTARRIWQRLLEEHGADLAESTVREVVRELRTEIGGGISSVMIVACHAPGEEAEVDFGEATIILAGEATKVHLFHLRLNSSGKAVTLAFLAPDQTAFLEGHAIAFARLGGVPTLGFAPHPLIEEAIREAVRCLRADLYLPALAMLAKAAEGFWTLLAVALGAAAPGEASAVKLARGAGDGSVPFAQLVSKSVGLFERRDLFPGAAEAEGASLVAIRHTREWTEVVRDGRNVVHFGATTAFPNTYEKAAVLFLGAIPAFRTLAAATAAVSGLAPHEAA